MDKKALLVLVIDIVVIIGLLAASINALIVEDSFPAFGAFLFLAIILSVQTIVQMKMKKK